MVIASAVPLDHGKPVLLRAGQSYLRGLMRKRGLTVTALAAELGISRKHLSNVLNGSVPLLDPLLGRLCQALAIDRSLLVWLAGRWRAPAGTVRLRLHEGNHRGQPRSD